MADGEKPRLRLVHVLFIDIVNYSKLRTTEQSARIQQLREIVRSSEQFRAAEAEGKLLRLPRGDGGALFFRSLEAPIVCGNNSPLSGWRWNSLVNSSRARVRFSLAAAASPAYHCRLPSKPR
ncbi:MAG: hypothetical protein ACR2FX_05435 [Chthoniobacterales bacterium]